MALINIYLQDSEKISLIINQNKQIMTKIEDLQAGVVNLQEAVNKQQEAIATAIAALQSQISTGASEMQLQGIIDGLTTVQEDVASTPTA